MNLEVDARLRFNSGMAGWASIRGLCQVDSERFHGLGPTKQRCWSRIAGLMVLGSE